MSISMVAAALHHFRVQISRLDLASGHPGDPITTPARAINWRDPGQDSLPARAQLNSLVVKTQVKGQGDDDLSRRQGVRLGRFVGLRQGRGNGTTRPAQYRSVSNFYVRLGQIPSWSTPSTSPFLLQPAAFKAASVVFDIVLQRTFPGQIPSDSAVCDVQRLTLRSPGT
jgi:hypothetical protein